MSHGMGKKMDLAEYFKKFGKRCPHCNSGKVSSGNSHPLTHQCLDCKATFPDTEAKRPPKNGWPDWKNSEY